MSERVSVIPGHSSVSVILVTPRGADDKNINCIAEACADEIDGHAVLNRGFEKSDTVDVLKDKADCSRINHITQEVVYDEFLEPIKRIKERMVSRIVRGNLSQGNWGDIEEYVGRALIFYLYGVGNNVHKEVNDPISVIVGIGGKVLTSSYTSEIWRRDLFVATANDVWEDVLGSVYVGHPKGKHAGRSEDNINQYFRLYETDRFVESMQLSFPLSMRTTESQAMCTGITLGQIISRFLIYKEFDEDVEIKFI